MFKRVKFLIIGEKCLDRFIYGNCDRLCPEAPVPVFVPTETIENDGMAANVNENLKSIINSHDKDYLVYQAFSEEIATKTRYVDAKSNHIFLRIDEGDSSYNRININSELINKVKDADVILISDYNKGYLSIDDIINLLRHKKHDSIVIMDTKKIISNDLCLTIDYFKLNSQEYENNFIKIPNVVNNFKSKIIVTMGSKGTKYMDEMYEVDVQQTIDVSGAGDTFLASLGYYLGINKTISESIIFANKMASLVVNKRGVSIV